jgi:hypothetical protein
LGITEGTVAPSSLLALWRHGSLGLSKVPLWFEESVPLAQVCTALAFQKTASSSPETALKENSFLLVAHGTAEEVARAKDIRQTTQPSQLDVHAAEPIKKATAI